MKDIALILVFFFFGFGIVRCQMNEASLLVTTPITKKELLDIKLQLLSMNLAKESTAPFDLGRLRTPVYIWIDDSLRIAFQMEGKVDVELPKSKLEEIMREGFVKVHSGIRYLMMKQFADVRFNETTDIVGYWLLPDDRKRIAMWRFKKVLWVSEQIY